VFVGPSVLRCFLVQHVSATSILLDAAVHDHGNIVVGIATNWPDPGALLASAAVFSVGEPAYSVCLRTIRGWDFVAVNLLEDRGARTGFAVDLLLPPSVPSSRLLLLLASCLVATCVGPYSFHL
jgi:hypothetical protein